MQIGIFAKTFVRPDLAQTFDAVRAHGLDSVQFNWSCAGLPTLPEAVDPKLVQSVVTLLAERGLTMSAISGTGNLIHPDPAQRAQCVARLQALIGSCAALGTRMVTLCTGSRDGADMWRWHPGNLSPGAWRDLVEALEKLLPIAESHGIGLGVEPEPANVIASAPAARRLLDEMKSSALKIVLDGANLVVGHPPAHHDRILSEATELLGPAIALAHAKDVTDNPAQPIAAAGRGILDYARQLSQLRKAGFEGPIILHGLEENEVPAAVAFLRQQLARLNDRPALPASS